MISFKHKFIFIHCQKTGGRSIERCLEKYIEYDTHTYNASTIDTNPVMFKGGGSHTPLMSYYNRWKPEYGSIYDFFKFGCIRNPWERAISFWLYWQKRKGTNNTFSKERFKVIAERKSKKVYFCSRT